ncbi:hypothetical protein J7F01_08900 [Streptomyces sp. ISL-22]|uniref:hypothetical protein n=1 Tax=unclassified Streptomyces TaxID=2593676 RepID=UPI001BEC0407|nr:MULTISPECIES: hypothetical protein [unclassified Streptomyces]MBT2418005.1 hypothetical protein [Streptomyces sp. ISL-24]MBT2432320.1 hypothetical protein [Streptomyces sp. ISL-22]
MELKTFAQFEVRGHIKDLFFAKSGKVASVTLEVPHRYLDGEVVREFTYEIRCTTFDRKQMDQLKVAFGERDFVQVKSNRFIPAKKADKGFFQAALEISTIEILRKAKPAPKADVLAGLGIDG